MSAHEKARVEVHARPGLTGSDLAWERVREDALAQRDVSAGLLEGEQRFF